MEYLWRMERIVCRISKESRSSRTCWQSRRAIYLFKFAKGIEIQLEADCKSERKRRNTCC
jgi:hypothetical protein